MSSNEPLISVVIPAYNRVELLYYSLESLRRVGTDTALEVIVVDDGSQEELAPKLSSYSDLDLKCIRQANQGSIVARDTGLKAAQGKYVCFLDSDDLVHAQKFKVQIEAMEAEGADVSYCDIATTDLVKDFNSLDFKPQREVEEVSDPAVFYLRVQPLPHVPVYRRDYLLKHLTNPLLPPKRIYDSVGDVWIYYNLASYPAKIIKVDGYYSIAGQHDEGRYTQHWEDLGCASLALMLDFLDNCPEHPDTINARVILGECAFISWRKLPLAFNKGFEEAMLGIWKQVPKGPLAKLGGRFFQLLARILGPLNAARLIRYCKRPRYSKIRTMPEEDLKQLLEPISQLAPM